MAIRNDRVGEILEGDRHNRKILISPEGVPLNIRIATNSERFTALVFDLLIMFLAVVVLIVLLVLAASIVFHSEIELLVSLLSILVIASCIEET